jgi:hypothetical protein
MMIDRSKSIILSPLERLARSLFFSIVSLCCCSSSFGVQTVTLGWSPSPSAIAGYMVYWGTASGVYSTRIDAGTNLTFTVTNLQEGTTYYFVGTAYDDLLVESAYSNEISYNVPNTLAPTILSQPTNVTAVAGATATFTVTASGPALAYQWFKAGTALPGATSALLSLPSISDADAGIYSVIITNLSGAVTSSAATLTVIDPPLITSQPVNVTNVAGSTVTFSVGVNSAAPVSYQWFKGGIAIPNSSNASLTLTSISATDSGNYTVTVTNIAGTAISSAATLTVIAPPVITSQPASVTNIAGTTVILSVGVNSAAPVFYQWFKSGAALSGANNASLTVTNFSATYAGIYTVTVTNVAGTVTSSAATLTLLTAPVITKQPMSLTNTAGTTATFTVGATGTAPLNYQWFKSGIALAGATSSSLSLAKVSSTNSGNYTVSVANPAGTVMSTVATLTVTSSTTKNGKNRTTMAVTLNATANHWYELQASTNLVDWNPIWQTTTTTNDSAVQFDDNQLDLPRRFYRWIEH